MALIPSTNATVETEFTRMLPQEWQPHYARVKSASVDGSPFSPPLDADVEYQSKMLGTAKVGTTADPRAYLKAEDRGWQEVTVFACVWTPGQAHAERLKAAIERMIARQSEGIRRSWHDLEPEIAELTLAYAAEAEGIEVFDGDERRRRIKAWVDGIAERFGGRG